MSQYHATVRTNSVPDDYPVRPDVVIRSQQASEKPERNHTRILILMSVTYFLYGSGISIYGVLYPKEAKRRSLALDIYGSVLSSPFFIAVIFYPVAIRMVLSITCKQSLSMSTFMIGACRILFGTLSLITSKTWLIALSFAVQVVEGIGTSSLIASTHVTVYSQSQGQSSKQLNGIYVFLCLGIIIGPTCGIAVNDAFDFSIPFYGIGVLTILNSICIAILLREPAQRVTLVNIPLFSSMKEKRMQIYFSIIFFTFNYIGFLSVTLEPVLHQYHLNRLFIGLIFAISPFVYCLSVPCWVWLTKKGFNTILLICIASVLIFASLILIGPAPFVALEASLNTLLVALLLHGLGTGGKLACVSYAANKDLISKRNISTYDELVYPTTFILASLFGYFTGSIAMSFTGHFLGLENSTYILFGLESFTIVVAFIFAFKRNYRSPRYRETVGENAPIFNA